MNKKTKTCQNCKSKFIIEPADFEFYQKIDVPEPTFCPECRMQRRMAFRKEGPFFYKRKCAATNKDLISVYHPKSPVKIFEQKYWFSDKWDPMEYGRDYDFNRPFFEQFKELLSQVPIPALVNDKAVRSDYCTSSVSIKNCYLATNSAYSENSAYITRAFKCKDCLDLYVTDNTESCYQDQYCLNSYKLFFSNHCESCIESYFLYDCRNCQYCFGCVNLRHKKYHIFNKPYSKEEYFKKIKEFNLGSYQNLVVKGKEFDEIYQKSIRKFANITKSANVSGDEVQNSKNSHYIFDVKGCENVKFASWASFVDFPFNNSYDIGPGAFQGDFSYEITDVGGGSNNYFAVIVWYSYNTSYCFNCHSSANLFGSIGLRHKKYCILNKQYTKKSFDNLRAKIIQQMNDMPYTDKKGRVYKYGEFFPIELSPFSYGETIAQEQYPITKSQAVERGYPWYDKTKTEHQLTIKASQFIPSELKFYRKMNLPLPRLCPSCRYKERVSQKNPMKLWERQCMKEGCQIMFQTTYSPSRKEMVYCEECYNKEVS